MGLEWGGDRDRDIDREKEQDRENERGEVMDESLPKLRKDVDLQI